MLRLRLEAELPNPQEVTQVEALALALDTAAAHLRAGTRWVENEVIDTPGGGKLAYLIERQGR